MSQFPPSETTPNPIEPVTLADVSEAMLPPGGLLDLDDVMAEALAAVEAVEAKHESGLPATAELPEGLDGLTLEDAFPPQPVIRGAPVAGSSDVRGQLELQVRDLTLALAEAKRKLDRDNREVEQLLADLSVTRKRYHKLGMEHDELRKRLQKAEMDLPDQGARGVLLGLLGPLDHLHEVFDHLLARESLSPDGREAMQMLQNEWQRAFAILQVTPFDAVGQAYDPQLHEFIAQTEADAPPGQVVRQVGRGYLLAGRLLRSARVVVSAVPGAATDSGLTEAVSEPEE